MYRLLTIVFMLCAGCGGGGGNAGPGGGAEPATSVTVSVAGLAPDTWVTLRNGSAQATATQDGAVTLPLSGAGYDISVEPSVFLSCAGTALKGSAGSGAPALSCSETSGYASGMNNGTSFATDGWVGYTLEPFYQRVHGLNINAEYYEPVYGTSGEFGYGPNLFHFSSRSQVATNPLAPGFVVVSDTCNGLVRVLGSGIRDLAGTPEEQCGSAAAPVAPRDGKGSEAVLQRPGPLAVEADRTVWVAEDRVGMLRRIAPDGTVSTVPLAPAAGESVPGALTSMAVALDQATLYLTDGHGLWAARDGVVLRIAGVPDAFISQLHIVEDGTLYFKQGQQLWSLAADGTLQFVKGSAEVPVRLYDIAHANSGLPPKTVVESPFVGTSPANLPGPSQIAVGRGYAVVASVSKTLLRYALTPAGQLDLRTYAEVPQFPQTVIGDADGTVWFLETWALPSPDGFYAIVRKRTPDGKLTQLFGLDTTAYDAQMALGADGRLAISMPAEGEVRVYSQSGQLLARTTAADVGQARMYPEGAAYDSQGRLYFFDRVSLQVYHIGTDGQVAAFAGTANAAGYQDGPLGAARFNGVDYASLAIDGRDRVFLGGQGRVRMIDQSGVSSTPALQWGRFGYFPARGLAVRGDYLYGVSPYGVQRVRLPN